MNERRRFLQVVGSGTVALGTFGVGCSATTVREGAGASGTGAGGGGGGSGGSGGGTGTGGMPASTSSSSSTSASSSTTSSSGAMCEMSPAGTKVGKPSDYTSKGLHIVSDSGILIGRDAKGLYALTALCTHQFCDMSAGEGQLIGSDIRCFCHGSEFGPTGNVVNGPAFKPLKAYALALGCDGFLYVNQTKVVANTVRLDV